MKNKFAMAIGLFNLLILAYYHGWLNNALCLLLVGAIPGTQVALPPRAHFFIWVYAWLMLLFYRPTTKLISLLIRNRKNINLQSFKFQKA